LLLGLSGKSNNKCRAVHPSTVTTTHHSHVAKSKDASKVLPQTVMSKTTGIRCNKLDKHALRMLVRAFIYETCNKEGDDNGVCIYLHIKPDKLETYLQEFAPSDGSVALVDGPPVIECHGYGCGPHVFLLAEGVTACYKCGANLCHFCIIMANGSPSCFDCQCADLSGVGNDIMAAEMREALLECNTVVP